MTIGIVVFPGSNCDRDVGWALAGCLGRPIRFLWHEERDLSGIEAVVLPGGFSYGDYLRCGAIARFAPLLQEVRSFAERGGPVLGICNGFQILTEMGLLPGVLTRNRDLHFICDDAQLEVRPGHCHWLQGYDRRRDHQPADCPRRGTVPDRRGGSWPTWRLVVVWCCATGTIRTVPWGTWLDSPTPRGNVLGLMPHPERACDPLIGGTDGRRLCSA